jgi:hypothetical protein
MHVTCPTQLSRFILIAVTILCEEYKLRNSWLWIVSTLLLLSPSYEQIFCYRKSSNKRARRTVNICISTCSSIISRFWWNHLCLKSSDGFWNYTGSITAFDNFGKFYLLSYCRFLLPLINYIYY